MDWMDCPHDDEVYAKLKLRIDEAQGDEHYTMELNARDYEQLALAWNQGIDSHLEALTTRSSAVPVGNKAHCLIHPEELPTLVRRLFELDSTESDDLALTILGTLGIEAD